MHIRSSNRSTYTCHAEVRDGALIVEFEGRGRRAWQLPDRRDKAAIWKVYAEAILFAVEACDGAISDGQCRAVAKALSSEGYHRGRR